MLQFGPQYNANPLKDRIFDLRRRITENQLAKRLYDFFVNKAIENHLKQFVLNNAENGNKLPLIDGTIRPFFAMSLLLYCSEMRLLW